MKRRVSKDKRYSKAKWTQNQKLEAATTYLMLGSLAQTAIVTGVPFYTLRSWKTTDWFRELLTQIRTEDVQQLDSNLQRVVDKALKTVEDRLDLGDHQYDPKTGKLVRVPVKAHVALKVTTELLNRQDKIHDKPEKQEIEKTIDARLLKLSEEFARFAGSRLIEGEAVENPSGV